jgi:hypothetical protein
VQLAGPLVPELLPEGEPIRCRERPHSLGADVTQVTVQLLVQRGGDALPPIARVNVQRQLRLARLTRPGVQTASPGSDHHTVHLGDERELLLSRRVHADRVPHRGRRDHGVRESVPPQL